MVTEEEGPYQDITDEELAAMLDESADMEADEKGELAVVDKELLFEAVRRLRRW